MAKLTEIEVYDGLPGDDTGIFCGSEQIRERNEKRYALDYKIARVKEHRETYDNRKRLYANKEYETLKLLKELDKLEKMDRRRENWY